MTSYRYSNGDVYDGHFKEGQRHGHGLYHYGGPSPRSTSIYIGEWAEDNRHGYGVLEDIMKGNEHFTGENFSIWFLFITSWKLDSSNSVTI